MQTESGRLRMRVRLWPPLVGGLSTLKSLSEMGILHYSTRSDHWLQAPHAVRTPVRVSEYDNGVTWPLLK